MSPDWAIRAFMSSTPFTGWRFTSRTMSPAEGRPLRPGFPAGRRRRQPPGQAEDPPRRGFRAQVLELETPFALRRPSSAAFPAAASRASRVAIFTFRVVSFPSLMTPEGDLLAYGQRGDKGRQLMTVRNLFLVARHNHIPALHARLFRGAPLDHVAHEGAFLALEAKGCGQVVRDVLDIDAQIAPCDAAFCNELRQERFRGINGDGESYPLPVGYNSRGDAYHFATHIKKGAAGVSRIDGRIRLNEIVVGAGADDPAFRAHDASR